MNGFFIALAVIFVMRIGVNLRDATDDAGTWQASLIVNSFLLSLLLAGIYL